MEFRRVLFRSRQRFSARHAMLIDDDQPDGAQAKLADLACDRLSLSGLLRRVQAVPGHEARLTYTADVVPPAIRASACHLAVLRSGAGIRCRGSSPTAKGRLARSAWPGLSVLLGLAAALDHLLQHRGSKIVGFDIGEREEGLGPLDAVDLEDLG